MVYTGLPKFTSVCPPMRPSESFVALPLARAVSVLDIRVHWSGPASPSYTGQLGGPAMTRTERKSDGEEVTEHFTKQCIFVSTFCEAAFFRK
jgi:hypothetical protein